MSAGYSRLFREAVERMQALGGQLVPIDLAPFDQAAPMLYQDAFLAERYSAIRSFLERGKVGVAGSALPVCALTSLLLLCYCQAHMDWSLLIIDIMAVTRLTLLAAWGRGWSNSKAHWHVDHRWDEWQVSKVSNFGIRSIVWSMSCM